MRHSLITETCWFGRNFYIVECCILDFRGVKKVWRKKPGKMYNVY